MAYPYRLYGDITMEPTQSDDALPWLQLPINYEEEGAKRGVAKVRREHEVKGAEGAILNSLLPFSTRKTPLPAIVQREREKRADEKDRAMGKKKRGRRKNPYGGGSSNRYGGSSGSRYGG
jgi:hypothetical protein